MNVRYASEMNPSDYPKVTVIIPSYNHRDFVLETIDSVLAQDWPNIELLVIDNNSSDGSVELIQQHQASHENYQFVLNKKSQGVVSSLAIGLEMATGKYICQIASDDWLPPNSIRERVNYLEKNPKHVAVFSNGFIVDGNTVTRKNILKEEHKNSFCKQDIIPDLILGKGPCFATALMRVDTLKRAGGFNTALFKFYEDLDTPIRLALEGPFGFIDKILFFKRSHDSNVSTSTSYIRQEKVAFYFSLLETETLKPYRKLIFKRLKSALSSYSKHLIKQKYVSHNESRYFFKLSFLAPMSVKYYARLVIILAKSMFHSQRLNSNW